MPFPALPAGDMVLTAATIPLAIARADLVADADGLASGDLFLSHGRVAAIAPPGALRPEGVPGVDLDGGLVLRGLVDMHTHLDKGHIWPRKPNPDGSFMGALQAVAEDRVAHWSAEDVRRRMDFALRTAYAHGTVLIRTHIDSIPPQDAISWPVLTEMREAWKGRIELQGSCLYGIDRLDLDDGFLESIAARVVEAGGVLGAVTYMVPRLDQHLDAIFRKAIDLGLELDFHVDETADPEARSLRHIAQAALRHKFRNRVVV